MKKQNGKCIIFSAPSGAGKTTVVQYLLREIEQLSFSISATSRKARPNEANGKDYHFLSPSEFESKIKADEFLEWEEVYEGGFYYWLYEAVILNAISIDTVDHKVFLHSDPSIIVSL